MDIVFFSASALRLSTLGSLPKDAAAGFAVRLAGALCSLLRWALLERSSGVLPDVGAPSWFSAVSFASPSSSSSSNWRMRKRREPQTGRRTRVCLPMVAVLLLLLLLLHLTCSVGVGSRLAVRSLRLHLLLAKYTHWVDSEVGVA